MTSTPADLGLAPDAAARLDDYLQQVRAALTGATDVNPDEIGADICEHVENELRAAPRPVPLAALEAVLAKLGPPAQWGAAPDPTVFHRAKLLLSEGLRSARSAAAERAKQVRLVLWNGPEDWRLAYLSFGVFALGALTLFVLPLALVVSYILSRAGLAVAKEKGIEIGAGRKWLLYPPLVIVSSKLLLLVAMWPAALGVWANDEVRAATFRVVMYDNPSVHTPSESDWRARGDMRNRQAWMARVAAQVEEDRKLLVAIPVKGEHASVTAGFFVGFGAVVAWWTVVGFVSARFPETVRAVFPPLCNRFERHHGAWIGFVCLVLTVAWCGITYNVASAVGLI